MTNVWLVITVVGKVGMSVGPLPYDMNECRLRATEINQEITVKEKDPSQIEKLKQIVPDWKPGSMHAFCMYHDTRPGEDEEISE